MSLLTDYVVSGGSNALQFASVVLSAANGTSSQLWPTSTYFKVPFNGKFQDSNNFCTLNASTSTLTLPSGLYQIYITQPPAVASGQNATINSRLRTNDTTTVSKWCTITAPNATTDNVVNLNPAGLYLASQSTISFEQYWTIGNTSMSYWSSQIADGVSNVYYRMDIWKLK